MAAELIASLSIFKTMFDMAKALQGIHNTATRDRAVIELQKEILSAQTAQSALIEQVGNLEKEVAHLKAWDGEKQRYELKDLHRGLFAYIPKEGMESGESPHALCTNCYQHGVKSILQSSGHLNVHDHFWFCPSCKMSVKNQWRDMDALIKKSREIKE
jgi:hypothetical protein